MIRFVAVAAAVSLAVACGPKHDPDAPTTGGDGDGDVATTGGDGDGDSGDGTGAGDGDGKPSEDELRLAAFASVMKKTAPDVRTCWAAGAADDYHLSGRVVLKVGFDGTGAVSGVDVLEDAPKDEALTKCLVRLYKDYAWPTIFKGASVQVPFEFEIPKGQYTVFARHVETKAFDSGHLEVVPLLHPGNTGNNAASMALARYWGGHRRTLSTHKSAELLYMLKGKGVLYDEQGDKKGTNVEAGSFAYVPAGKIHGFKQRGNDPASFILLFAGAGPEVKYFGGKDPGTHELSDKEKFARARHKSPKLKVRDAAKVPKIPIANGKGWVQIAFDKAAAGDDAAYIGRIFLEKGVAVPKHNHPGSTELLWIYKGTGTLTVSDMEYQIVEGTAVQIPAGLYHSFVAAEDVEAIQFYTPSGPEQRFRPKK